MHLSLSIKIASSGWGPQIFKALCAQDQRENEWERRKRWEVVVAPRRTHASALAGVWLVTYFLLSSIFSFLPRRISSAKSSPLYLLLMEVKPTHDARWRMFEFLTISVIRTSNQSDAHWRQVQRSLFSSKKENGRLKDKGTSFSNRFLLNF